jgi:DNA-binding NtrC family response regulator
MSLKTANCILIVDDQENWRQALRILLESEGFAVLEATTFHEAEDALAGTSFDVVVLDVRLVDEDMFNVEGLALQNMISAKNPDTRIVILTGYPKSVKDA